MAFADLAEGRNGLAAFGDGHKAARMEAAARGRVEGAGNFTFEDDTLASFFDEGVGNRHGGEQGPGIGMEGIIIEFP